MNPRRRITLISRHPLIAISPLLVVGILNLLFTRWIPGWYGVSHELTLPGLAKPIVTEVGKITAIWAVGGGADRRYRAGADFWLSQYPGASG